MTPAGLPAGLEELNWELPHSFLGLDEDLLGVFRDAHGELLTPAWWRSMQERIRADDAPEVLPY